jgi:taurine transport system permease protein
MSATDGRTVSWVARRHEGTSVVRNKWLFSVVSLAAVFALWWGVTAAGLWNELILPSPAKVWHAFIQSVTVHDGQKGVSGYYLWQHLWASLWRILKGVLWAIVVGVPLGLALGVWHRFELLVGPIVSFLRSLPPLGYFSLLIIWFGIDDTSKVWLLFIAAFAPIALAVAKGVSSTRTERLNASLVLGASNSQVVRYVVAPSVMPDFLTGVRIAVGFAWTTIVAAETSNGIPGIGGLAWATKKELRSDIAILCIIVIGATAVLLDALLRRAEHRFASWHGRA